MLRSRRTRRGLAALAAAGTLSTLVYAVAAPAAAAPPPPPSDAELAAEPARQPLTGEQFYFVLPDRFANGDPANDTAGIAGGRLDHGHDPTDEGFYHGGDLRGLIDNLDYIEGLGTTAIWMAPIFRNKPVQGEGENASAGYHGYWITDFTRVDPHFGTNEELAELVDAAHDRGIKVFFDVITNHTADVTYHEEDAYEYLSKGAFPYLSADGRPFDDRDHADAAGAAGFPELDRDSFPYTPAVAEAEQDVKVPAWLNDPTLYHNRGDSTFAGENAQYGDFYGLDDLFTERPEVVEGMAEIYQTWVGDFGIDGFRIDTVKHVNMEFWTQWSRAMNEYAAEQGNDDFFMFGEVYSSDPAVMAPYVTEGGLDATLDFGFQEAARSFVSQGGPAQNLARLFEQDYRYTAGHANAYQSVTFLGNHDMGRIGGFLAQDNPGADDAELLRRATLANELMFLSRGNPVVYYGDEQGFTGSGGDKAARATLFASQTPVYLDDDRIGTEDGHDRDAYDPGHPLYRAIAGLSALTREHPALRNGTQIQRHADEGAGVYAHTRTGEDGTEYLVAASNADGPRTVTVPVGAPAGTAYQPLYGDTEALTVAADGTVELTVPALSTVVLRADAPLPGPQTGPSVELTAPGAGAHGTVEITAGVSGGDARTRVVFAAQTGDAEWQVLGSDDQAPYRVGHTVPAGTPAGTTLRYKAVAVDSTGATASDLAGTTAGEAPPEEPPQAVSRDWAVIHYHRPDGDYDDWSLWAWGDLHESEQFTQWPHGRPFTGRDAYGAFAWVRLAPGASSLGYLIVDGDGTKDVEADRSVDLSATGEVWVESGRAEALTEPPEGVYPPQDESTAVLHYRRPDGDYDGWGLHVWTGAQQETSWSEPLPPARFDAYGAVFEVPLAEGATSLSYIVHKGDQKDLPADQSLSFASHGREVWMLAGEETYLLPGSGAAAVLDPESAHAQWIDAGTVVWPAEIPGGGSAQLVYHPEGSIAVENGALTDEGYWIRLKPTTLTDDQRAAHPHLAGLPAYAVDPRDADRIEDALRSQLLATQRAANGALTRATGVQIAGVLDDLYAGEAVDADLGPTFPDRKKPKGNGKHKDKDKNKNKDKEKGTYRATAPVLSLWAPTAQHVAVEVDGRLTGMTRDDASGVWSVKGKKKWYGKPYRYHVTVWAPDAQAVVTNEVTDPYSTALTADSEYSLIVDLDDPALAPAGWRDLAKPEAVPLADATIQELHVRDFSIGDPTADHQGRYLAFTEHDSDGMRHLSDLARAGTSYVHLLPTYDIASIPERAADQAVPDCDLAALPADSAEQQDCIGAVRDQDAYNWGYDPLHYNVPEGSYASDPDGTRRTLEFRQMVQGLNASGLRVVLDVVYNHTPAAGQDEKSVLDRIVPGYYHRLLEDGSVATSTCCANTAPENVMMGKLVVDSVVLWARHYKVDGFRFDLMGHHPKQNMLDVRAALDSLTPEKDGVDGKSVIVYGEGWNFGEAADDARFEQATQLNMAGTGIGTFSDRARDAVRGGGPFDADPGVQGFASGLYTDPNASAANGSPDEQLSRLLTYQDLIKVGLTGNLADYTFTASDGSTVTGSDVSYNGSPAGYADAPGEAVAYVDAHDNETLFDALAFKLPAATSAADRSRMQVLAMATALLSQGPAFGQAGSDLLRSKSLDRNSYNSGDWYNTIFWDCSAGNGFGRGLPPAWDNEDKWPFAAPLLTNPAARPGCAETDHTARAYQDLLTIRSTEDAFRLTTLEEVQEQVSFPLSGTPAETPGVITMRAGDLVVVFNATPGAQSQTVPELAGEDLVLHPVQADGSDPAVKEAAYADGTGTFTVPGRTVAVFTASP
ncbi:pullulanase-type alpha-1,6-glucosidase [Streptomyces sp. YIM 98790]|uniref:pullulanase-type alpha-1,6-glucosidase n=1 Tax=Streptomyces sp. YIM 98790 TaxID=2689077 RepID=UPI00140C3143|nr:pullulanase-type alpha-1,6-glucosidase [Streptomyces sp. YIM 98790]